MQEEHVLSAEAASRFQNLLAVIRVLHQEVPVFLALLRRKAALRKVVQKALVCSARQNPKAAAPEASRVQNLIPAHQVRKQTPRDLLQKRPQKRNPTCKILTRVRSQVKITKPISKNSIANSKRFIMTL